MDNIDFSELNPSYFLNVYKSYKDDKSKFNKNDHIDAVKKYKLNLINIIHNDLFTNGNAEKYGIVFKNLKKKDQLAICTLPFRFCLNQRMWKSWAP